ncbi:MAG: Hdr-like menaquinol oxidoreductase cytochrome c subunit [Gammaproteobacteria bacterium]|jgi:hypothetical protein|nr:Hdr-like menaquinol oxidoreductase cytochrome c subunit [Gammaproteobacteria bacterium]
MRASVVRTRLAAGAVLLALLCLLPLLASAGGRVPLPDVPAVPAEKGTQCVEDTEVMRRNHMEFLLHQRDETMHQGIRTKKYSLKECIGCHVNPIEGGGYPEYGSEAHFCSSCHTYAAVDIDCFQCHNDEPEAE